MSGVIVEGGKETAKRLNDLARHQFIVKMYQEILYDAQVCEIEGWDKTEFVRMIKDALSARGANDGKAVSV